MERRFVKLDGTPYALADKDDAFLDIMPASTSSTANLGRSWS